MSLTQPTAHRRNIVVCTRPAWFPAEKWMRCCASPKQRGQASRPPFLPHFAPSDRVSSRAAGTMHCTFCGHIAVSFTSNCSTVRWQKPSTTSAACTRSARIFPKAWFGSERRRLSSRSWSGGQGVPRAPSTARAPCPETPSRYKCKASVLDSSKLLVGVAVPAHSDASHATDARGRRAQPRRDADQPLLGPVAPQPPPGGARIRPARRRCAGRAARMGARGAGPRERTRRPSPPRIREPRPRARVRGRHRAGARVPQPSVLAVRPPPPPYCCPYPCPYCTHTEPAELRYRPGRGHAPSPASDWISWRLVRAALPCAFARARARGFAFVVRLRVPRARASRDLWARRMTRARAGRPPSPSPSPY